MKKLSPLPHKLLRQTLNHNELDFKTTAKLESLTEFVGQERALEAVNFGIGIKSHGYNLYAMGPAGIGKRSLIRTVLTRRAKKEKAPPDWCYIHNFEAPEKPIALKLPTGLGLTLQQDMKTVIQELSTNILSMFESDEYSEGMKKILKVFNTQREKFQKKHLIQSESEHIPHLYKERHEKEKELQLRFTANIVKPSIQKLKNKYAKFLNIVKFLNAVQNDIINNVNDFINREENTDLLSLNTESPHLLRYQINLLVNNRKRSGAPVIFEENPSYSNLICRVEYTGQNGIPITNFTLIRAGAIHRANGGYLVIEARKLKKERHAWEGLKRALSSRRITIEQVDDTTDTTKPISLEPASIPLDVKVILLGDRHTFHVLSHHDSDFGELFKVTVDFDEIIDRNKNTIKLYARLIGTIAKREGLRPFHASAVAAVIDHSSRLAEDIDKLSTHIRNIDDLILEADYWAGVANKKIVKAEDVKKAIAAQIHRVDRTRELYYEDINRNFVLIKTSGQVIGQANCLSVVAAANKFSYGHPTRITAKVRMGKGEVIDIQREIHLAGPIHTKAGLILSHFLSSRYILDYSFSLSASISFEQIYGTMEGDSASIAELATLLSALAKIPIKQSLAVTGSINQYGEVQVIGGVNEKIEGFFDICKARNLTGEQGVIIPRGNIKNLMLREDIVEACKKKKFFIYAVDTVDEAMTLLMGKPAGERNRKGEFPENTINYLVEEQLKQYALNRVRERKK